MDNKNTPGAPDVTKQVVEMFGKDILRDEKRFCAAFSDLAPKLSKERKAFSVALSENIGVFFLREHSSVLSGSKNPEEIVQQAIADISEYLNTEKSELVVRSLAFALGWETTKAARPAASDGKDLSAERPGSPAFIEELFRKAKNGDNDASFNLGERFFYGRGVEQDYAKAVKWYTIAADRGDCSSQKKLADCYYLGQGTERNTALAAYRYEQAAEQGDYDSQQSLIRCYRLGGPKLAPDPAKMKLYSERYGIPVGKDTPTEIMRDAEKGSIEAQFSLGNMYLSGMGFEKDPQKAIFWFKKAAATGHAEALYNLGCCYFSGIGVPVDKMTAVMYYKKAAKAGDTDAMNNLAGCFLRGEGTDEDQKLAAEYYLKAASMGNAKAQYNYGECCFNGKGVPKSYSEAAKWYKESALQKDPDGQYSYGWCLSRGLGVAQDLPEAKEMFELAAIQRHSAAQKALAFCYVNGTGTAKNYAHAADMFSKAAARGDKEAAELLVACYKYGGEFLAANEPKARHYAEVYELDFDSI